MSQIKGFAKNVFFEQSKKFATLLISLAFTLIIVKHLGPANFGLVTYFIGFTSIVNVFGVRVFEGFINVFMPKLKNIELFWWSVKWQYAILLPVLIGLFIFSEHIANFLGKTNFLWLQWAVVLMFFMVLYTDFLALFKSLKMFGKVAKIETLMQISALSFSILFVIIFQIGVIGIIYAQLISVIFILLLSFKYLSQTKINNIKINKDKKDEIKEYGKFTFLSSSTKNGYGSYFKILLGLFILDISLGFYYLIEKITAAIMGKSTGSIQTVLIPYSVEKNKDKKTLGRFVSLGLKTNLVINLVLGIVMIIITKPFLDIFMPEYSPAYAILPLYIFYKIINSFAITEHVMLSLNKGDYIFYSKLVAIIISAPLAYYFISAFALEGVIYSLIVFSVINSIATMWFSHKEKVFIDIIPRKADYYFMREKLSMLLKAGIGHINNRK